MFRYPSLKGVSPGLFVLFALLALPGSSARAEVKEAQLLGRWTGSIIAKDGEKTVEQAITMTFEKGGKVIFEAAESGGRQALSYDIDGDTLRLRKKKNGKPRLSIAVDFLSPTELSGVFRYRGAKSKQAVRITMKRSIDP